MCPPDRIEDRINAAMRDSQLARIRDEIASAIVDRGRTKALHRGEVLGRAGTDCLQAKMAREIEYCGADCPRCADDEDGGSAR